ncbi:hypothetical protein V6Z11_A11G292700 [Gossypium hirsutum]
MQTIHGQVISEIIESCRAHGFADVILVHEHRGIPDGFIISHLPFGPTAYFGLLNVATCSVLKNPSKVFPCLSHVSVHRYIKHHTYEKPGGPKSVELKEIGPRTMEKSEALIEWVIRPYMTTTKKRSFIENDPEPDDKRNRNNA